MHLLSSIVLASPHTVLGFPGGSMVKNLAMQETQIQSLSREDSPGEGNGIPLQCSCLENPKDRGA